jgi:glycosyltransferase involved in cell wall biosynthesis
MPQRLIIHAPNINQGGGAILLRALLIALANRKDIELILQLDTRLNTEGIELPPTAIVFQVSNTVLSRFNAEYRLIALTSPQDIVLCFGNLPPLFKILGRVCVYLQNRYIVDKQAPLNGFSFKVRMRIRAERLWFRVATKNASEFMVQTPTMQHLLEKIIKSKTTIRVATWADFSSLMKAAHLQTEKKYEFIYVASGEPHKNHKALIEAWCLLAREDIFPRLCLTLSAQHSQSLLQWINEKKGIHKLHVENIGSMKFSDLIAYYLASKALIHPSLLESFTLPLVEAKELGLAIVASELDHVRDYVDPIETFDPNSPVSIARAVKRFLGVKNAPTTLMDAESFIAQLLKIPAAELRGTSE